MYARNIKSDIIIKEFEGREIKCAFHDIDGTHSLIREWPPVMSICLYNVIVNGVPEDFDSKENEKRLIEECGKRKNHQSDAGAFARISCLSEKYLRAGCPICICNKNRIGPFFGGSAGQKGPECSLRTGKAKVRLFHGGAVELY